MHTSYLYPLRLRGGYICYIIKPVSTYVVKTKHAWGQAFFMGFLLFLSDFMVPLIIFYIVGFAILGKRPVFDDFLYNRLQLQDAMSRHRGAKPPRRCGLLGEISLLSPG